MSDQAGRDPLPSIDELIYEEGFREGMRAMARFLDERVAAALERPEGYGGPQLDDETRDRAADLYRRYLGVGLLPDTARAHRQFSADRPRARPHQYVAGVCTACAAVWVGSSDPLGCPGRDEACHWCLSGRTDCPRHHPVTP